MMTEQEWLACTDPNRMLEVLHGQATAQKLRLFACACIRQIWDVITDEPCYRAVEVAERFVDGEASQEDFDDAADEVEIAGGDAGRDTPEEAAEGVFFPAAKDAAWYSA